MKNSIMMYAIFTLLITGITFSGCQDSDSNVQRSQENVVDAQSDLEKARIEGRHNDAGQNENQEWKIFKKETELKIRENELRIAELRERMNTSGQTFDNMRSNRIDDLERKNRELKNKIDNYDQNQGNWESFKRSVNQTTDDIAQGFRDL